VVNLRGRTLGLSGAKPLRVFEVVGLRGQIWGLVGSSIGTICGLNLRVSDDPFQNWIQSIA
jgi:ABC-type lipoprotein release transport system permease subunit